MIAAANTDENARKIQILGNATVTNIRDAANQRIDALSNKISNVNQSIGTETATNAVFFSCAAYFGFEDLHHAAIGTGAVYLRLAHIRIRSAFKRAATEEAQDAYERTKDSNAFSDQRLIQRTVVGADSEDDYEPFFTSDEDHKSKNPSPYSRACYKIAHVTGAFLGGTLSTIGTINSSYYADLTSKTISHALTDPLPDLDAFKSKTNFLNPDKWGIIGSVINLKDSLRRAKKDRPRTFVEVTDTCDANERGVLRSIFRTKKSVSIAQIPQNEEENKIARKAYSRARLGDYCEMLTNTAGILGASEFTLVVFKNAVSNGSSPETYGLAALWAATAWVSLDPLKHQIDDMPNIRNRIAEATEAIRVLDAGVEYTHRQVA